MTPNALATLNDATPISAERPVGRTGIPDGSVAQAPSSLVRGRPRRLAWLVRSAAAGLGAVAVAGLAIALVKLDGRKGDPRGVTVPARRLQQASALLSFSVLADSGLEHYRANFQNRAMFAAPTVGLLSLSAALMRLAGRRLPGHSIIHGAAALTGGAGLLFHVFNVGKRPGRFDWGNLFYGAPLGAPVAAALAGVFGFAGSRLERHGAGETPFGPFDPGRTVGTLSSLALIGTTAEVALLHFRGSFQNPFMLVPVTLPPLSAIVLAGAALQPNAFTVSASRALLGATGAVGLAGVGFHAYGIARNMGGWRNWSQMLLQGPPLPAPPSFTGAALAGLGAIHLLEHRT